MVYKETARNDPIEEAKREPMPMESLTDIVKETGKIAYDVRYMSGRLYEHLFGSIPDDCENGAEARCLQEEMMRTRSALLDAVQWLAQISAKVGL